MKQAKVIFLLGPTAAGKTKLAIELYQHLPIDIISVDSAMIYRDMDIGTGKPDKAVLKQIPHRLVNIINPDQIYNVENFRLDALAAIESILKKGRIPLLVGGTMMYFKALIYGLAKLPAANAAIRQELEEQRQTYGLDKMHQYLQQVDLVAAKRIHPNDPQRLLRALEVYRITGKPLTELLKAKVQPLPYDLIQLVIAPLEKQALHSKIVTRFDNMLAQGLIEEVINLRRQYHLNANMPSMRCVGYRQVWQYLEKQIDKESMRQNAIVATRQLAKRQYTWLRSLANLVWFDNTQAQLTETVLKHFNRLILM